MVRKYARLLEEQEICYKTGEIWTINDVPNTWRKKTQTKVEEDGYTFDEEGHAVKKEEEKAAE
jgi:hypothetical protein